MGEIRRKMTRLYINITNKCNAECDFCCMWSSPRKTTFMDFETYKGIIDSCKDNFELQLEGGEPLLHDLMYLFVWYAHSTKRCKRVIVLTNGIILHNHIDRLTNIKNETGIPFLLKVSINSELYSDKVMKQNRDLYLGTEFIEGFNITFNVRLKHGEDWLVEELKRNKLYDMSNIYYLQSYGKLENDDNYDKPVIVQNIENWKLYSCDGMCFEQDLISRSNHEKETR